MEVTVMEHTLASHIAHVRDRKMSLCESWFTRFRDSEDTPDWFELWTIVPLTELTADDIIWALIAAAMDPEAAHLILAVFPGNCANPVHKIEELVNELTIYGFCPYDLDWSFEESAGEFLLRFSVFSEKEAYHIQDLYYES